MNPFNDSKQQTTNSKQQKDFMSASTSSSPGFDLFRMLYDLISTLPRELVSMIVHYVYSKYSIQVLMTRYVDSPEAIACFRGQAHQTEWTPCPFPVVQSSRWFRQDQNESENTLLEFGFRQIQLYCAKQNQFYLIPFPLHLLNGNATLRLPDEIIICGGQYLDSNYVWHTDKTSWRSLLDTQGWTPYTRIWSQAFPPWEEDKQPDHLAQGRTANEFFMMSIQEQKLKLERFDGDQQRWCPCAPCPILEPAGDRDVLLGYDQCIYCFQTFSVYSIWTERASCIRSEFIRYDPSLDTWTVLPVPPPSIIIEKMISTPDGLIYLLGRDYLRDKMGLCFDTRTSSYLSLPAFPRLKTILGWEVDWVETSDWEKF